jgi:hypothetical protein
VAAASFDSTGSLAGHGGLCDGSTHDLGVCSDSNGRSGEHIAHQDTVGAHGESGTEDPKHIFFLGAVQKHNSAFGTSREGGTGIEDKHGARVSLSVKIDLRIGRSYVDGRLVGIDSRGERHAPHLGKHGLSIRHCSSNLPGGQSICGATSGIRHWRSIASKVARNGGTWIDTEVSTDDVTIKGTSTGGCRARQDGEILAGTEDDRFISVVTELAVTVAVNSTKIGEGIIGGRLSEAKERTLTMSFDLPRRKDSRIINSKSSRSHIHIPSQRRRGKGE